MVVGCLWFPFRSGYLTVLSSMKVSCSAVALKVLQCADFWLLCSVHVGLFWLRHVRGSCEKDEDRCDAEKANWKEYEINIQDLWHLNALTVLMLYGFNWHCYHRLLHYFKASGDLTRQLDRVSLTLRVYLEEVEDRWNVVRYLLASIRTSKYGIQAQRALLNKTQSQLQWDQFMRTQIVGDRLLLQEEADFLTRIDGNKQDIICSWCLVSMRNLLWSKREQQSSRSQYDFALQHEHALVLAATAEDTKRVRAAVSRIGEQLQFALPCSILPFISILLWANLLLLAYALLFVQEGDGSYLSLLVFPLVLFFLLGLREASNLLVSPLSAASCYDTIDAWTENFISDTLLAASNPNEPFRFSMGAVRTPPPTTAKGAYSSAAAQPNPDLSEPLAAGPGPVWTKSVEQSTEVTRQLDATLNRLLDLLPTTVRVLSPKEASAASLSEGPPEPALTSTVSDVGLATHETAAPSESTPPAPALDSDAVAEPRPVLQVPSHVPANGEAASSPAVKSVKSEGSHGTSAGSSVFRGRGGKRSLLSEGKRPHLLPGDTGVVTGQNGGGVLGRDSLLGRSAGAPRRLDRVSPLPPESADTSP